MTGNHDWKKATFAFLLFALSACSTPEFQYEQKQPDDCCAHYAAKGWCAEEIVPGCSGTRMMDAVVREPVPGPEKTAGADPDESETTPARVPEGF